MEPRLIVFLFVVLALINADPSKIDQLRQSVTPEDQRSFIKVNVLLGTLRHNSKLQRLIHT